MNRILRIPGRDAAARRARLAQVEAWMGTRGWRLADFAEEAGSALFERPAEAPPLGPLDATRWLPGPRALHPSQWWVTLRADHRVVALPGLVLAVALVLGLALFGPSTLDVEQIRREAEQANWYTVTADQLNVRGGPGTQHPVVGVLYRDQRVMVEAEVDAEWVKLGIPERGYVSREYLAKASAPGGGDGGENTGGDGGQ